jgi:hypothetical protein
MLAERERGECEIERTRLIEDNSPEEVREEERKRARGKRIERKKKYGSGRQN